MPQRVLLVEDSARLRPLIERILKEGGYVVSAVRDTASALQWLAENLCGAELILCDMMLPDGTGLDLSRRAAAICPQAKSLHMSGFQLEVPAGVEFISKPFTPEQLLSRIQELLKPA